MRTSAEISDQELDMLRLLVPSYVGLELADGSLLYTLHRPSSGGRDPLVTFALTPAAQPDFSGDRVATVIEDLNTTLLGAVRALADVPPPGPDMADIVKLVGNVSVGTSKRLLADRALRLSTEEIHTVEGADWLS